MTEAYNSDWITSGGTVRPSEARLCTRPEETMPAQPLQLWGPGGEKGSCGSKMTTSRVSPRAFAIFNRWSAAKLPDGPPPTMQTRPPSCNGTPMLCLLSADSALEHYLEYYI